MSQLLSRPALTAILPSLWNMHSSLDPVQWRADNAGWGQSAATALVIADHLGGDVLRSLFRIPGGTSGSHYLNLLPDGTLLDLAAIAYPPNTQFLPANAEGVAALKSATRIYLSGRGMRPDQGQTLRDYLMHDTTTRTCYLHLASSILRATAETKGTA